MGEEYVILKIGNCEGAKTFLLFFRQPLTSFLSGSWLKFRGSLFYYLDYFKVCRRMAYAGARMVRRKKAGFHQACCVLDPLGPTISVGDRPLFMSSSDISSPNSYVDRAPVPSIPLPPYPSDHLAGPSVAATTAAFGGRIGRDSYAAPAYGGWMTPLFRGPPPNHISLFGASWPRRSTRLVPRGCATDNRLLL